MANYFQLWFQLFLTMWDHQQYDYASSTLVAVGRPDGERRLHRLMRLKHATEGGVGHHRQLLDGDHCQNERFQGKETFFSQSLQIHFAERFFFLEIIKKTF